MRDGFQMETHTVPTDEKIQIAMKLIAAGVKSIEITSFVSPRLVPQLADAAAVISAVRGRGAYLSALVPNRRGAERAVEVGADAAVIFISASETHNLKNINRSIAASLSTAADVAAIVRGTSTRLQGAIATAFGCPYEGDLPIDAPMAIAECYARLGISDISLGDTTGMATPPLVEKLVLALRHEFPQVTLGLHFHNTRGLAMANVLTGLELGIDRYESSIAGLGGCPFAPGATGNVCTEDLVYLFDELGIDSGVKLECMIDVAKHLEVLFGRILPGQVMKAGRRLATASPGERHSSYWASSAGARILR
jgi:hydroxymethylglutaryl-CoA lyase